MRSGNVHIARRAGAYISQVRCSATSESKRHPHQEPPTYLRHKQAGHQASSIVVLLSGDKGQRTPLSLVCMPLCMAQWPAAAPRAHSTY